MPTERLTYASREELEDELGRDVLRKIGNGVFVDEVQEVSEESLHARLGAVVPDVIEDPSDGGKLVNFLRYPDVTRLRFTFEQDKLVSEPVERDAFGERLRGKEQDLIARAEQTLLDVTKHRIARVQPVGTGLNPIREILIQINEHDSVRISSGKKYQRYVPFLKGLGYVEVEGDRMHPGPEFLKFERAEGQRFSSAEFYDALLGEILDRGYSEIVENLNVSHVVPIVRLANAYYWPSFQYGEPLKFRPKDFRTYVKRHHKGYSIDVPKIENYLLEMERADMVQRVNGVYREAEDVWERYQAEAEPLLQATL